MGYALPLDLQDSFGVVFWSMTFSVHIKLVMVWRTSYSQPN